MYNPYDQPEPPRCRTCDEFKVEVRERFLPNYWECRNPTCEDCAPKYRHNFDAYTNGFDAWQAGYDDALYDGIDMSSELPCKCALCMEQYYKGQEDALAEIENGKQ